MQFFKGNIEQNIKLKPIKFRKILILRKKHPILMKISVKDKSY